MSLLLGGLSWPLAAGLGLTAAFTSLMTAAMGIGGGTLLLAVLAQILAPGAIIPVHGTVQLGSNLGRSLMTWRHIDWRVLAWFLPGALAGALVGRLLLVRLPPGLWYLTIAVFILFLCWGPAIPRRALGRPGIALAGMVTTFASLFIGASGPLVGAFIKQIHAQRFRTVATFATAMSAQHGLKVAVFSAAGFPLQRWLGLIALMIGCGALGTWLGLKLLQRLQDRHFQGLFKLVLTLLALRLLWQAALAWGL